LNIFCFDRGFIEIFAGKNNKRVRIEISKMKKLVTIFIVFISVHTYGQNEYGNLSKSQLIESLRNEFFADTIKFEKSDIIQTERGKKNINPYSKLVIINGELLFKPDVMESKSLTEFLDEIFIESKIKDISAVNKVQASFLHFEGEAMNGFVAIHLEKEVNLSLKILGLALNEKVTIPSLIQDSELIEGYYLVIDEFIIQLDSNFNPKWIKKIEFIKNEKYKDIYGNTGGKIYIYPKKRFKKKLLEHYKHN
jgi:hypothetical protein